MHIGFHKTGTSSFPKLLAANAHRRRGIWASSDIDTPLLPVQAARRAHDGAGPAARGRAISAATGRGPGNAVRGRSGRGLGR